MATPTDKSEQIEDFLENITGKNRRTTIEANQCMTCDKPATEFRDELSRREYSISGMCQSCQDASFNVPNEDDEEPPPATAIRFNSTHAVMSEGVIRGIAYDQPHDAYMITLEPQWRSNPNEVFITFVLTEAEIQEVLTAIEDRKRILDFPIPPEVLRSLDTH